MAFDRAAAKAAGYSDEEIDAYIRANPEVEKTVPAASVGSDEPPAPTTQITPIDHTASTVGTVAGAIPPAAQEIAGLAAKGIIGYKGVQLANAGIKAFNRMGTGGAVPPSAAYGSPGAPIGSPVPTTPPPAAAAAEGPGMLSRAGNLVKAYGPALAKLGTGLSLALHSGELNAGEDEELRKMREREKQMNGGQAQNAINSGYAQQLRLMGRR